MVRYLIVSIVSGILFGVLDALINANPLAQRLNEVYKPIARTSVNAIAGILIDLAYGFIMAAIYLTLYRALPSQVGVVKGLVYGLIMGFFRVVMYVATQWMTLQVPGPTLLYGLLTGLAEMLILGVLYGLTLRPAAG